MNTRGFLNSKLPYMDITSFSFLYESHITSTTWAFLPFSLKSPGLFSLPGPRLIISNIK